MEAALVEIRRGTDAAGRKLTVKPTKVVVLDWRDDATAVALAKRVDPRPPGSRNEYQAGLMRIIRAAKREGITPAEWREKYGDEPPEPIVRGKKRR